MGEYYDTGYCLALEAAHRGAALLDEHEGSPLWDEKVNLETLDLGSALDCIIGQVKGTYGEVYSTIGLGNARESQERGFTIINNWPYAFETLTQAWKDLITQRREVRADKAHAREVVEAGAALLDQVRPGWDEQIDLELLSLPICEKCIVGQLEGDYTTGLVKLGIRVPEGAARYGFTWDYDGTITGRSTSFEDLEDAWNDIITERQRAHQQEVA